MAFTVLYSLPLMLVAAGLVLLVTSIFLNRRARGYRRRMKNLLLLAERDIEPLEIPAAAWPQLADSGWQHLHWQGRWFGQHVTGELGALPETPNPRSAPLIVAIRGSEDAELTLTLTHGTPGGETRMFAEHLARVFILLLESRLRARTEALSAALAERAHLSLYLQHDMRNLAQWVNWVSADFAACSTPETLLAAALRLRDNAPLARERAERLFEALGPRRSSEVPGPIDLRQAVAQAAQMAGIEPEIEGEAQAWVAKSLLARALDNLFSNLASTWRDAIAVTPRLQLRSVRGDDGTTLSELGFQCPWPTGLVPLSPEKLFEPFASGRPGGLGLGLYQARRSLREAQGDLLAQSTPSGIDFLLRLPASPVSSVRGE